MKRSELNAILRENEAFLREMKFNLPPFAYFTPEEWKQKDHSYDEIRRHMLGWDITDYGTDDYRKVGLFLFTIRNGSLSEPDCIKTYAEKLLIVDRGQVTPMHYHAHKMEDIINRGGGVLAVKLYNSLPDGGFADTPVTVTTDGHKYEVPAGSIVRLAPGESISLPPFQYHAFWGEGSKVLVGEVSMVNDDNTDNYYHDPVGRFPKIEEDEAPLYLLCNEYPEAPERCENGDKDR